MKTGAEKARLAVAYYRVSTDDQVESGAGLAAQRAACRRYAEANGLTLLDEFEESEGVSGKTDLLRRPKLIAAVALLKENKGGVFLCAKRDRVARDRVQIALFESAGLKARGWKARLISAAGEGTDADPDDPMAFLLRAIVDVFAEFERLLIGFRTAAAMQARRERGESNGRVPYGSRLVDDGRRSKRGGNPVALEDDAAGRALIARAIALRDSGLAWRKVSAALADAGFLTRAGKPFHHDSLISIYQYHKGRNVHESATGPQEQDPAGEPLRTAS